MIEPAEPLPYEQDFEPERNSNGAPSSNFYSLTHLRHSAEPRNHGLPWDDVQHQRLVDRVRAGDDMDQLAEAVGRKTGAVTMRLRRLLPPDNRDHPSDLLLSATREFLSDPDADWRGNLLRSTKPRPIVAPPAIVRTGIGGIEDDDLVNVAHALVSAQGEHRSDLLERIVTEVQNRALGHRVVALRVRELRYLPGCTLSDEQLVDVAHSWLWQATRAEEAIRRFRSPWHDPEFGY